MNIKIVVHESRMMNHSHISAMFLLHNFAPIVWFFWLNISPSNQSSFNNCWPIHPPRQAHLVTYRKTPTRTTAWSVTIVPLNTCYSAEYPHTKRSIRIVRRWSGVLACAFLPFVISTATAMYGVWQRGGLTCIFSHIPAWLLRLFYTVHHPVRCGTYLFFCLPILDKRDGGCV